MVNSFLPKCLNFKTSLSNILQKGPFPSPVMMPNPVLALLIVVAHFGTGIGCFYLGWKKSARCDVGDVILYSHWTKLMRWQRNGDTKSKGLDNKGPWNFLYNVDAMHGAERLTSLCLFSFRRLKLSSTYLQPERNWHEKQKDDIRIKVFNLVIVKKGILFIETG